MAFSAAVGHSTLPLVTGNFSVVSGAGFTPSGYMNVFTQQTAAGYLANILFHIGGGAAVAGIADFSGFIAAVDAQPTMDTGRIRSTARDILGAAGAGAMALTIESSLVSFGAGIATTNFTNAPDAAYLCPWFALGGDVTCGAASVDTGTVDGATLDFTRSGFGTPNAIIVVSTDLAGATTGAHATISVGACDGTTQWSSSYTSQDNVAAANVATVFRNDTVCALLDPVAVTTYLTEITFNSWITDGVRLTVTNAPGSTSPVNVFLIKGGTWKCGVETQHTSNAAKVTSGLGLIPKFGFFAGPSCPTTGTIESSATNAGRYFVGFTDGSNQRGCSFHDVDAALDSQTERSLYTDRVIRHHTADGSSRGDATIAFSTTVDEYTATWSSTDGTAYPYGYLLGGDAVAAAVTIPALVTARR